MQYLQQTVTKGRYTLPLIVFLTFAGWIAVYFLIPDLPREGKQLFEDVLNTYLPDWGIRALSLLTYFAAGYFLIQFNNRYLLIRRRASMQTSFYLLFITACPVLHANYMAGLATVLLLFAIYNLFKCYQSPSPMGYVLNAFVFLGFACLLFPHLMLFIPVFLFGVSYVHSLSFRNFMAAVIGLGIPIWLLWSYAFLTKSMELFYAPFLELIVFEPLNPENLQHPSLATSLYFFIVFIITAAFCMTNANKDKISTRIYLRFIITFVFFLFVYVFLQPGRSAFLLPPILTGVSILAAHYFVLTNSKASNLFFICTVLGLMFLFGFNIWILS